ncbi:hypothetical protein [Oscillatoria sp. FACHB-1406]|uniref:hypothetical protein n=1 Tax=Oscillatoria sp. FACHB-1406 TaxID=2692846 RepID=UPI0016855086|nr:hypothetical protein [Oscillatoria sp. FACHB-1406]MBD2579980.1 hypothetical protein [Oscillatoria sp. FACHB-1406]
MSTTTTKVKVLGKMLVVVALGAGVMAVTIAPSLACGGRYFKSKAGRQPLPGWVGAIALTSILGAVAGNEALKRASTTDEPIG